MYFRIKRHLTLNALCRQSSNSKAFSFWLVTAQYLIMYLSKTWLFIFEIGRATADFQKTKKTHPVDGASNQEAYLNFTSQYLVTGKIVPL